jgi:putative transcriptional regulator
MTIRHHIDETLLLAYAAGSLSEAFGLVIATHLTLCDECRARAGALDALGGAILAEAEPSPLDDAAEAAALARILALPQAAPPPAAAPARRLPGEVPAPLADYVGRDFAQVRWRPVGMGVRQAILNTGRDASARLLYIPAGAAMPDHGHNGLEMTLVLKGAFLDEGRRFGPGDVEIADAATEHRPVAEDWGDCICLAASDQKLRFTGLLPRLAQPFFRI